MSTNDTKRWRAAVLAAVAAASLGLVGCVDQAPTDGPGTEQEDGNGGQEDGNGGQEDGEQEDGNGGQGDNGDGY